MVLLPVPLRPTVYQSSMISKSSRGISSQRRSGGCPRRAVALDRHRRGQPVAVVDAAREEAAARPAVAAVDGHDVADGVDHRRGQRVRVAHSSSCASGGNSASSHMCAVHSMCTQPVDGQAEASSMVTSIIASLPSSEPPKRLRRHQAVQAVFQQVGDVFGWQAPQLLRLGDALAQPGFQRARALHGLVVAAGTAGVVFSAYTGRSSSTITGRTPNRHADRVPCQLLNIVTMQGEYVASPCQWVRDQVENYEESEAQRPTRLAIRGFP